MRFSAPDKLRTLYRSLAVRIIFLTIVFLGVPIIFYQLFRVADTQQSELLLRTVEQKGSLIASALKPHLQNFQNETPDDLRNALQGIADQDSNIKILLRPKDATNENLFLANGNAFLYVAAFPAVSAEYLKQEHDQLIRLGVLDELAPTCDGEISPTLRFTNPAGKPEVLTSVTPIHLGENCWVVITSESTQALLSTSIGQPVWRTPAIHIAVVIYFLSAVLVAWLFVDMWRNFDRFRTAARKIRTNGVSDVSFREMNIIPEFTGVADDFDSLVKALAQSKRFIVQAAEENAHAFKAPLAVIAQAIEPLKRAIPSSNVQARRSIEMIERSTARLDILVSAARDLEQATADEIAANAQPIDLSTSLSQLIAAYESTLTAEGKQLQCDVDDDVHCYATEEAIESVIENLLENAASFVEPGGTVAVRLTSSGGYAHLTVADDGPGVPANDLPMIFNRNFSSRGRTRDGTDSHFGLGLWIVQRNVEALGGRIAARNRDSGGFSVTASFRAA